MNETDSITSLPRVEQLAIAADVIDCFGVERFVIEAFSGIDLGDDIANLQFVSAQSGAVTACIEPGLMSSPRGMAILGFVALTAGEPVADTDQAATTDLLVTCSPPSGLVDSLIAALVPNAPEFVQGIDKTCAAAAYEQPGVSAAFWNGITDRPLVNASDGLPQEMLVDLFGPVLDCMSLGTVIVNDAASNGVPVPPTTVLCIDEAIADTDVLVDLFTGTLDPDDASISGILISCLSGG